MKQAEITELLNQQHTLVLDRESKLSSTDYVANKIAEGEATQEDYAATIAARQQWREDIRKAKEEIKRLEAIEPEPDEELPEE